MYISKYMYVYTYICIPFLSHVYPSLPPAHTFFPSMVLVPPFAMGHLM